MLKKIKKHLKGRTFFKIISKKAMKPLIISYFNAKNRIMYGPYAPRFGENIWIIPNDSTMIAYITYDSYNDIFFQKVITNELTSGLVINYSFPLERAFPITETKKLKMCIEHWVNGLSWEETGMYEENYSKVKLKGQHDGLKTFDDIVERYKNLDEIFKQAKQDGKLRAETTGTVHLDSCARIIWTGGGQHRLAIAYILKIPIPAKIGLVHVNAIPYLNDFRKSEND